MALATRCPSCNARFRVAADQLKLRAGLVRCGACQHAFDATATLSYVDDATLSDTASASVAATASAAVGTVIAAIRKAETVAGGDLFTQGTTALPPVPAPSTDRPPAADHGPARAGEGPEEPASGTEPVPAAVPAVSEVTIEATEAAESVRPAGSVEQTHGEPIETSTAAAVSIPDTVEAAFLHDAGKERRRVSPVLLGVGALVLALLLLGQFAAAYRAEILVRFPQARPALGELCRIFRCTVDWPARHDLLAVVGTELQALPGTAAFELTAVVRNRGSMTLALPAIELTLSDTLNRTLARKVFAPSDYLAGDADAQARLAAGLEAGADLMIKIAFEARGVNAAGFVVYPFYL